MWMGQLSDTCFLPCCSMGERGLLEEEKKPPEVSRKHVAKLKPGLQHQYNIFGRRGT